MWDRNVNVRHRRENFVTVVPTLPWHSEDDVRPMWDLYIYIYIHIGMELRANCGRSTRRVSFYGGVVDPSDTSYFAQDLMKERMVRLSMNVS